MRVNVSDILTAEFLQKYTVWKEFKDFELSSPLDFTNDCYWQHVNKPEFNQFIASHSEFSTWTDLVRQATKEFMAVRVGV